MRIAVTGHRPNKLGNEYDGVGPYSDHIREQLSNIIDKLKPTELISGMALGVDMIFAELAIEHKLPYIAAVPCKEQSKVWPTKSRIRYAELLAYEFCRIHLVSNTEYTNKCMQKRNEWMVDHCDLLVAVHDGSYGGTWNCVNYATGKVPIITINPDPEQGILLFKDVPLNIHHLFRVMS